MDKIEIKNIVEKFIDKYDHLLNKKDGCRGNGEIDGIIKDHFPYLLECKKEYQKSHDWDKDLKKIIINDKVYNKIKSLQFENFAEFITQRQRSDYFIYEKDVIEGLTKFQ